jgi:RNA polymerase sigma factor (sigma-70 family)
MALLEAARKYDSSHPSAASFETYATKAINHAMWRAAKVRKRDVVTGAASLDQPIKDGDQRTLHNFTAADPTERPTSLDAIQGELSDREYAVLDMRLDGRTQDEIAAELGVSRQRVSVIEAKARKRVAVAVDNSNDVQGVIVANINWSRSRTYRKRRISWKEWDDLRFKQEWQAQGCNPTKKLPRRPYRKFIPDPWDLLLNQLPSEPEPEVKIKSKSGETTQATSSFILANELKLARACDPRLREQFYGFEHTNNYSDETKITRTKHRRKQLEHLDVDGGKSFDQAVESLKRDGCWVLVTHRRGGMIATRHKVSAKPALAVATEAA